MSKIPTARPERALGEPCLYAPPCLTVVTFAAERGFALSGGDAQRNILAEFFLGAPADGTSTGESRTDEGYLF